MEVFDEIISFLEIHNLYRSSILLKEELAERKPPQILNNTLATSIRTAISKQAKENKSNEPESEAVLENLMSRIISSDKVLKPKTNPEQISNLLQLKVFQKIVKTADTVFKSDKSAEAVADEDEDDLPRFGNVPVDSEEEADDSCRTPLAKQFSPQDDDELFAASTPDHDSVIVESIGPDELFAACASPESDDEDEYVDDDDTGFEGYTCTEENFCEMSEELASQYDFPRRACRAPELEPYDWIKEIEVEEETPEEEQEVEESDGSESFIITKPTCSLLPKHVKFPITNDEFYPIELENTIYDCFPLRVVYDREKTGFEETKEFQIVINSVIAGRFQVMEYLGSAAFSKAIQCLDLFTNQMICLKIIENNKDYVDQSLDEIKVLRLINLNADVDEKCVLKLYDCFYYKEHLMIVTELLRDNLYEFCRYNRENEEELYFTVGRLQRVAYQILTALNYVHDMHLIHCDLKPENILIKSYSRCQIKVIDFGSSCFTHDHLSSYVQSRSYRAPEVILGCAYDTRVDIWSLGCIIPELFTGNVLFQNETVQGLLAKVMGIIGSFPDKIFKTGRLINNFFTSEKLLYQEVKASRHDEHLDPEMIELIKSKQKPKIQILVPKKTTLRARVRSDDDMFIDFIRCMLDLDPDRRPTAKQALQHPWLTECKYIDGLP